MLQSKRTPCANCSHPTALLPGEALHSVCLQTCLSAIKLGALFSCLNIETRREDAPAPGGPEILEHGGGGRGDGG